MKPSGSIFYEDGYGTIYVVAWETVGRNIDITTETRQPYVWGVAPEGFVKNGTVFRKGIITVHRQVLKPLNIGYEVVAEGYSQIIDFIQTNFRCGEVPTDKFQYHYDDAVAESCESIVTDGARWADPNESTDSDVVWGTVNVDGTVSVGTGEEDLTWIDVWG